MSSGGDLSSGMQGLSITGAGSGSQRKADSAYNHMELAVRPGTCKAARGRINVVANFFRLNAPAHIKFLPFRVEFEVPGRGGTTQPLKKEQMADAFKKCYEANRGAFPTKTAALVYNSTDMFYTPIDFRLRANELSFVHQQGQMRGRAPDVRGKMYITPLPMVSIPTVRVESEEDRCGLMSFLDSVITQDHRFDLTGRAARFIQHGHSLFKIPETDTEKKLDVKKIGRGEEVWMGLHCAVKTDFEELMLNADTSGSIFKCRGLHLIRFYAEVQHGYSRNIEELNFDNIAFDPRHGDELSRVLKGAKVALKYPWKHGEKKMMKFDRITDRPAVNEYFDMEHDNGGKYRTSVAQYYLDQYEYRLRMPNFPCLSFFNKQTKRIAKIPVEFFYTAEEPARFTEKLSEQQLDVFIKAVCQSPKEKKARIERLCVSGRDYLGDSACMKEWGVSLDRKMVKVENCAVLPFPHIEMKASSPHTQVDANTGEWKITENIGGEEKAIGPVEKNEKHSIKLYVTYANIPAPRNDGEVQRRNLSIKFIMETMRRFNLKVYDAPTIYHKDLFDYRDRSVNTRYIDGMLANSANECSEHSNSEVTFIPVHIFVFPRRQAELYSAIKYHTDVVHGLPSQCVLMKTFEKLTGNPTTNTSSQNLLLKILAKVGYVQFRLSTFQHLNVERMQKEDDAVLILGVDVSHPSKEERFDAIKKYESSTGKTAEQANKYRGRHEQLPTARPAGAALFQNISFYDCPRSVVSVVGSLDIKGSRYGCSSRVQRLGQEETVNMIEPFKERIKDFFDNTGCLPNHVILYRDGVSDSQLKKIAYEECEALERALETFDLNKESCTITYITAAKRHHSRFFRENLGSIPEQPKPALTHWNCPPGTLVETVVVSRTKFDFYLQSHYGNLGTASPTRYTVVRDDWKVSQSFIQTVVFAHCFGNVRCSKPLSIPIPLHYAHLSAKRAKIHFDYFKQFPSNEYCSSKEDLVREEIEKIAVTPNLKLKEMKAMHFA